jgi:ribosomal protein S4E
MRRWRQGEKSIFRFIQKMKDNKTEKLIDGCLCKVTGGTHKGKSGIVRDIKTSKTGFITITVEQANGVRFKTLGKNVLTTNSAKE